MTNTNEAQGTSRGLKASSWKSFTGYMSALKRLVVPFWKSPDSRMCRFLLLLVVLFSGASVFLAKQFNAWYNDFYNSVQNYDLDSFWCEMLIFSVLAAFHVYTLVTNVYIKQKIMIDWRHWLSKYFMHRWLQNGVFFKMQFDERMVDNPDQRIAADINEFVDLTFSLTIGILTDLAYIITFSLVLWDLSSAVDLTLGDTVIHLPDGYLFYIALGYAVLGTVLVYVVGHPLIRLNFLQQRVEADFRYSLVRVRENSESIALYHGAQEEFGYLEQSFGQVVRNFYQLMVKGVHVGFMRLSYKQASVVFPFIISAPLYFAKVINLGILMQIASAFGHVLDSMSTIIDNFASLARWKSVTDRLVQYNSHMENAEKLTTVEAGSAGTSFQVSDLMVSTPDGRTLMMEGTFTLAPGDALLIRGPSGCGKSTMFRTIAGLWPFASGSIVYPDGEPLFLSQKPYIPLGSLRRALCYPHAPLPDHVVVPIMEAVRLGHLISQLDSEMPWGQILSLGEQQRVAFARAMLIRPRVLFMDEASASLDEDLENLLYSELRSRLKTSVIISVGHRSSLKRFHNRFLEWAPELVWHITDNPDFAEEGSFSEKRREKKEQMDGESFERFRQGLVYRKEHNPPMKPSLLRRLLMFLGRS